MIALALLLTALLSLYLFIKHKNGYFKRRGIPYAEPLPLLGNATDLVLLRTTVGDFFADMHRRFSKHGFGGFFLGPNAVMIACDPELVKQILVKDYEYFLDRGFQPDEELDPIPAKLLFFQNGEKYREMAKRLRPASALNKIKKMFVPAHKMTRRLTEKLSILASEPVDILEVVNEYSINLMMMIAAGIRTEADSELVRNFRAIVEPSIRRLVGFFIAGEYPWLIRYIYLPIVEDSVIRYARNTISDVYHEKKRNGYHSNSDIMDFVIGGQQGADGENHIVDNNDGRTEETRNTRNTQDKDAGLLDDDLIALIITFMIGSGETNARATVFACHEMALNPEIQRKAQLEIDTVLEEDDGQLTYENLQKMEYMEMIILEVLRKHTPFPVTNRACVKRYQIPGTKCVIEEGMHVYISIRGMHYDPRYYPDPHKFDPERFNEENRKKRPSCAYIAFGGGPRMCSAVKYSLMVLKIAMVHILRQYDICVCKETPVHLNFDPRVLFLHPKEKIMLKISQRQQSYQPL